MKYITNAEELRFHVQYTKEKEQRWFNCLFYGDCPDPSDRDPLDDFKWAIDQDGKLYWQNPETGEQLDTDGNYGKGKPTTRVFKRWARGMDL